MTDIEKLIDLASTANADMSREELLDIALRLLDAIEDHLSLKAIVAS